MVTEINIYTITGSLTIQTAKGLLYEVEVSFEKCINHQASLISSLLFIYYSRSLESLHHLLLNKVQFLSLTLQMH